MKITTIECDICHQRFDKSQNQTAEVIITITGTSVAGSFPDGHIFDLCHKCQVKLRDFLPKIESDSLG